VHSRGAAYCWHCGAPLMAEIRPSVLPEENSEPGGAGSLTRPQSAPSAS
jgi:hypothetical protein